MSHNLRQEQSKTGAMGYTEIAYHRTSKGRSKDMADGKSRAAEAKGGEKSGASERFVDTETDRTKASWVARIVRDFGRPTTARSLHYFAMKRAVSDYPICGGFVGEIRVHRQYQDSDWEKLNKWVLRAKQLGFISWQSVMEEEQDLLLPSGEILRESDRIWSQELWCSKPSLRPLLLPVCQERGVLLLLRHGVSSWDSAWNLCQRAARRPVRVCYLTDLDASGFLAASDLQSKIRVIDASFFGDLDIRIKRIGLDPSQVRRLGLPMVSMSRPEKEIRDTYRSYLEQEGLDHRLRSELETLEVYHPGGLKGFLEECLDLAIDEWG